MLIPLPTVVGGVLQPKMGQAQAVVGTKATQARGVVAATHQLGGKEGHQVTPLAKVEAEGVEAVVAMEVVAALEEGDLPTLEEGDPPIKPHQRTHFRPS